MSHRRILVLGGARSGKSAFAERLAAERSGPVLYVATATAGDEEMVERIARHRAQRPSRWRTLEIPIGIADGVDAELGEGVTIIVEDLTFLLSNLMAENTVSNEHATRAESLAIAEVTALLALPADIIVVSNEVGMGLVPPYPLGRLFRDALGRVNQFSAAACHEVYVLFAGLPLQLK